MPDPIPPQPPAVEEQDSERTAWHEFFGFLLTERAPTGVTVEKEVPLGDRLPRADFILLLLANLDLTTARVIKGFWPHVLGAQAVVIEFKSVLHQVRPGDLDRLLAYTALYRSLHRKLCARPSDVVMALLQPSRTPTFDEEIASFGWAASELGGGYWRISGGPYPFVAAFLDKVAEEEKDDLIAAFGHRMIDTEESQRWFLNHGLGREANMENLEGYEELLQQAIRKVPPEKRLAGVPVEERLAGIPADEAVLALPVEALRALSKEYLATLPEHVRTRIEQRLATAH